MPARRQEGNLQASDRQASPLRARPGHAVRVQALSPVPDLTQVILPENQVEKHSPKAFVGIMIAIALGCGLGLKPETAMQEPWNTLGEVAGWAYFAAWSLSFYPQGDPVALRISVYQLCFRFWVLYSNWRRKSVIGFSFDFALTNVLGFACLSIYYCAFYFDKAVRRQYRAAHHGAENAVRANDVFFALHALILTSLTLAQIGLYERGRQKVSTLCRWAVAIAMGVIIVYAGLLALLPHAISALSFLYLLSYIKVLVTASKYIPQALLNFRRKSTVGFNIGQMILDLTGGTLSFFQLALEAIVLHDSSIITGDPVKLCLALLSICYDTLLIYQHYVLYADAWRKPQQEASSSRERDAESLLPERT